MIDVDPNVGLVKWRSLLNVHVPDATDSELMLEVMTHICYADFPNVENSLKGLFMRMLNGEGLAANLRCPE